MAWKEIHMVSRRIVITGGSVLVGLSAIGLAGRGSTAQEAFPVTLTDDEWRERLTEEQFYILREHGTERAFSSPLDKFYEPGIYACAGCGQELYSSDTKF